MGYYMRVFCTSETIPTLAEVESEVKKVVAGARFETDDSRHEVPWEGFEYHYNPSNQPILVELNVNDAPDSMAAEEIEEFIGEMEDVDDGPDKAQVTAHLGQTRFVICCQLLGDITEEGFEANDALFEFFVQKYGGMIQADGEGFYGAEGLLVDLS